MSLKRAYSNRYIVSFLIIGKRGLKVKVGFLRSREDKKRKGMFNIRSIISLKTGAAVCPSFTPSFTRTVTTYFG